MSVIGVQTKNIIAKISLSAVVAAGRVFHDRFLDPTMEVAYVSIFNAEEENDVVLKSSRDTSAEIDRALVGDDPHFSATAVNKSRGL